MNGLIVLSSSGHETRMLWWNRLRDRRPESWTLVLPTNGQLALMRKRFMDLGVFFDDWTTLDKLAARLATQGGLVTEALDVGALGALLAETQPDSAIDDIRAGVEQVLAWQRAGLTTAERVRAASPSLDATGAGIAAWMAQAEALAGQRLGAPALPTAPYCADVVARALSRGGGEGPSVAGLNLYLEGFHTMSPVQRRLVHALSLHIQVVLRLRDIVNSPPVEAVLDELIGWFKEQEGWDGMVDPPPQDWEARLSLPETLFPDPELPPKAKLEAGERVRIQRFGSVEDELKAIGATVDALVREGSVASNIVVSLPETPRYRALARSHLHAKQALCFLFPAWAPTDLPEGLLARLASGPRLDRAMPGSAYASWVQSQLADELGSGSEEAWFGECQDTLGESVALAAREPLTSQQRFAQLRGLLAATPLTDSEGSVYVIAHLDHGDRAASHLFIAGTEGGEAVDARGGWPTQRPGLMPPIIVDAVESTHFTLWLSRTDTPDRGITQAIEAAFEAPGGWE